MSLHRFASSGLRAEVARVAQENARRRPITLLRVALDLVLDRNLFLPASEEELYIRLHPVLVGEHRMAPGAARRLSRLLWGVLTDSVET